MHLEREATTHNYGLPIPLDPNPHAVLCNAGQSRERKIAYLWGYANLCNAQQPLTAHS
jgi:hypothetical protein